MVLSLDHGGPLGAQRSHGLEDIDNALILQTLEHDAQSDEHAGASDSGTERGRFDFKNEMNFEILTIINMEDESSPSPVILTPDT